ncbi:methyl-accepting chemotaxis protein [Komagataeibacter sp. FNDCR2]|uniref:HAMP domain-containing methyl-accepting chemotaxis protein n=1 Tax=Komagataeibacter sp. FNDCR2 TaxID=2878682 RepID=UPI001E28913F|nr:methyl-accepting chemotaxis protein [Komagataeibacter sp. FNDCR2]
MQICIAAACITAGICSVRGLSSVNNHIDQINHKSLGSIRAIGTIGEQLRAFRSTESDQLAATTPEAVSSLEAMIGPIAQGETDAIEAYAPLVGSHQEEALFRNLRSEWQQYRASHAETFADPTRFTDSATATTANARLLDQQQAMSATLSSLTTINTVRAGSYARAAEQTYSITLQRVYGAYLVLFVVLAASVLVVYCNILRPLKRINATIKQLAGGDTTLAFPYGDRGDEIGDISRSLEVFRSATIRAETLQKEAEHQREQAEINRRVIQDRAEANARAHLKQATGGMADALKRMVGGDLSFRIETPFSPEFEPLRRDFNEALTQLASTFSAMSTSVLTVDDGIQEMATGAEHLARRTAQESASLEQTAAAVAGIAKSVALSARRSDAARQIGITARETASDSARITDETANAMQRIEEGSGRIVSILEMIDNIAFHTNILALNASVEAARAGEVGRGFGVVASEVRSLAEKSTEAARDIRALVLSTASDIQEGASRVRDSSEALRVIVEFIAEIGGNLDAIALASHEQSISLDEINTAIAALDGATQQNAAVAEQFSATSRSIVDESHKLNSLIGQFLLPDVDPAEAQDMLIDHAMEGGSPLPQWMADLEAGAWSWKAGNEHGELRA